MTTTERMMPVKVMKWEAPPPSYDIAVANSRPAPTAAEAAPLYTAGPPPPPPEDEGDRPVASS